MLMRTTAQNASVSEQRKLRKTNCSAHTPTLNIGARGASCRCMCTAKCISRCHLLELESFANLFPSTVKKAMRSCPSKYCAEVFGLLVLGLCCENICRAHMIPCTPGASHAHPYPHLFESIGQRSHQSNPANLHDRNIQKQY